MKRGDEEVEKQGNHEEGVERHKAGHGWCN